ncbi:MAG: PilN domain-containing protein [Melioribacteraceae bacterium]
MHDNIFTKYIKNLSFFRISGIRKFILLDIHKDVAELNFVQIKEPFYRVDKSKLIESINLLFSEKIYFGNDFSLISEHLKNFVKKYELEEAYLIIGKNDFRFKTIKLPKDAEENELWFEENTDKFLPEGRVSDDFLFAYEKYFEDEDNDYYYLVIARRNYIELLTKACQVAGITIIKISPFSLQLHSIDIIKDKYLLYLGIREDKIIYTYSDNKHNLIFGETFLSNSSSATEETEFKNLAVANGLTEVKQNLAAFINENESDLNIFTVSYNAANENFKSLVKSIFFTENINPDILNTKIENLTPAIVLNNTFTGKDDSINLLPPVIASNNNELLEKKTSLRIVLSFGMALIILLLSIYLGENVISGIAANNENDLVEVNSKTKMLENYKNENAKLVGNLSMLSKLKSKRVVYSKILNSLKDAINNKSCFTNLTINELEKSLDIKIEGIAYSQPDVTEMIKKIEAMKNFKNISLEYANAIEKSKYKNNVTLPKNNMVDFSFSAKYNEN